jgi:saccharopine dehydrogenase-like NADP-dependent oxidoreductase
VLVQFGERRKVVEVQEEEDLNSLTINVKEAFEITLDSKIVLQEYDQDWEAWLDLKDNNVSHLRNRQKLCVVLQYTEGNNKQVVFFIIINCICHKICRNMKICLLDW